MRIDGYSIANVGKKEILFEYENEYIMITSDFEISTYEKDNVEKIIPTNFLKHSKLLMTMTDVLLKFENKEDINFTKIFMED